MGLGLAHEDEAVHRQPARLDLVPCGARSGLIALEPPGDLAGRQGAVEEHGQPVVGRRVERGRVVGDEVDGGVGPLHAPGRRHDVVQFVVAAVEREWLASEGAQEDLGGLVEAEPSFLAGDPEGAVGGVIHASAREAEVEAPAAQRVDGGGVGGDVERMMERQDPSGQAYADALRSRRQEGRRHQWRRPEQVAVGEVPLGEPSSVQP